MGDGSDQCGYLGVRESQEDLWKRVWSQVLGWLRRRVRNLHDAEDLAAECMRLALLKFGRLLPPWERLRPWAVLAARHRLISFRRKRPAAESLDCFDLDSRFLGGVWGVSSAAEGCGLWGYIVLRASEGDRATLLMLVDGASVAEIAAARGLTPRTIRDSRKRLRIFVREAWN